MPKPADYVDVAERIIEFRAKHPDGCLRPADPAKPYDVVTIGDTTWIVVVAAAYRTPDDPTPGIGMAWEQFPGATNFTRTSELQNAETSAWGRAIIAVGAADAKRGIASKQEVQHRAAQSAPKPREPEKVSAPLPATDEAKGTIVELLAALPEGERQAANETLENSGGAGWLDVLTADQASRTIGWLRRRHDALRASVEA